MKPKISAKRIAIDKANTTMLIVMGVAAFVVISSLVMSKTLASQYAYQNKVSSGKEEALKQAESNVEEAKKLKASYDEFTKSSPNAIGGNPTGTGDRDGDNARLVLDALPQKYDFPALLSSLEKVMSTNGFTIETIEGTDDEVAQAQNQSASVPAAIEMPFSITLKASGASMKPALDVFERSIRPIQIQKLTFKSDNANDPKITVEAKSYFQPAKNFNITSEPQR